MNVRYFWHNNNWQHLIKQTHNNRLPHALLFSGAAGLGKLSCALDLAQLLLCENQNKNYNACDACQSCQLWQANNHPDCLKLACETPEQIISVNEMRNLAAELSHTAHRGIRRVAIINNADQMNTAAANALLKTLEEPPQHVVIILCSAQASTLPATVISRCQKINFTQPHKTEAIRWLMQQDNTAQKDTADLALRLLQGAPLAALALIKSENLTAIQNVLNMLFDLWQNTQNFSPLKALDFANASSTLNITFLLNCLLNIVSDILKTQRKITTNLFIEEKYWPVLSQAGKTFSTTNLLAYQQYLLELKNITGKNIALNKQLLLESIWLRLFAANINRQ